MTLSKTLLAYAILASPAFAQRYQNISGIGAAGPQDNRGLNSTFLEAARRPLVSNNVSFPGFNFSLTPSNYNGANLRLDTNWTMHINYTAVAVSGLTNQNESTELVSTVVYDLAFPDDQPLPNQNDTDWTLCGHFLMTPLPSNLTDRYADETGDCSSVLGQECKAAYREAFLTASLNGACPSAPFWKDIPECVTEVGIEFSMLSSSLMLAGDASDAQIANGSYIGLNSTQPVFYQSSGAYPETEIPQYFDEYANGMRLAVYTFQPSREYLRNNGGLIQRDVQFVCGTANPRAEEEVSSSVVNTPSAWMIMIALATMWLQM